MVDADTFLELTEMGKAHAVDVLARSMATIHLDVLRCTELFQLGEDLAGWCFHREPSPTCLTASIGTVTLQSPAPCSGRVNRLS
jgi:hypothetical protein